MKYEVEESVDIIRGDTWDGIEYTVTRPGIDYGYAVIRANFKAYPDGPNFLSKEITPSYTSNGQIIFTISLSKDETALFNGSKVYSDIEITTVDGDRRTPILIKFSIIKDITV